MASCYMVDEVYYNMNQEEFEKRYAERSGLTVKELRDLGITIEPCDCGDEICLGWRAVS